MNPSRLALLRQIGFHHDIVQASGHYLTDSHGRQFLDFLAQYGAVPFGHNNPAIWNAITAHQSSLAPALTQPMVSPMPAALARRLVALAPGAMRHVTYTNSGAETVEAAIKLARIRTRRPIILSATRGFHGKTLGALSATDNPALRAPFLIDTQHFDRVPFNDVPALEARLARHDVAAFIVEAVQGEGGMQVASPGYLIEAAAACRRHGTLFVLDEIQTGLGRTGALFAAEHEPGLAPDIILLAKAMGGGLLAIGAMLCTADAWTEDFGLYHSSTFANNGLACAVAMRVLDLLLDDDGAAIAHAEATGARLHQGLATLTARWPEAFAAHSGRGLMQGIVLRPWQGEQSYFLSDATSRGYAVPLLCGYLLARHGIMTAPTFTSHATLRLEPPLTITFAEIDRLLAALDEAGALIAAGDFTTLLAYLPHTGAAVPRTPPAPAPATLIEAARPRPAPRPPRPAGRLLGTFAFLMHPTDDVELFRTLPAGVARLPAAEQEAWRSWLHAWCADIQSPATVLHLPCIRSAAGGHAEGWLIAAPLTALGLMRLNRAQQTVLLDQYMNVARDLGVDIAGLGAFVSVIARGGSRLAHAGVNLTSGNSLTAIASAESLRGAAEARHVRMENETVAVIGATGSIGRLAALHLSRYTGSLVLLGNPANPRALSDLAAVAGELYRTACTLPPHAAATSLAAMLRQSLGPTALAAMAQDDATDCGEAFCYRIEDALARAGVAPPLRISTDAADTLGRASMLLSASSAGKSFLDPRLLRPGAIVCDVARPLDVLTAVRAARPDVFVYEGGVMRLPDDVVFGRQNLLGYPPGYNLACLSETIVLAMEGACRSYSVGRHIDYAEACAIYAMALRHGFEYAILRDGVDFNRHPAQRYAAD
jgi:acetylornithine/succinyldiaminopimelate/putrescine aminotransferase/predicted amino acid dehydrogenase